ncbi:hypothetical protein H5410_061150 [Solanum commersonii]|uniref:Uncharacterized protein n=1 Tax=Solanum commersonii TaxID=4109 RepID=A0A9J5W8A1_SOLCO|nr:hypothetical protein H5410_061150 [Solanum commersonii]
MCTADHSATLVGIVDQLDDSPFGVVHYRFAPSFDIIMLWVIGRHSTTSRNFSVMRRLLPFFADLIFSSSLSTLEQKANPFIPFCDVVLCFPKNFKYLKLKGVSNSAMQNSIMNVDNKVQFTYAKIKCALKDSSCDSPISKNLTFTILASNVSSSSTIVFKCPHRKDDSIFTQWFIVKSFGIRCNAHSHKKEHNSYFYP